jgi:hypothetical protein
MSGLRARAHPNGSSSLEAAVQHNGAQAPPCCNGHGHDHAHTHPAANDPRRPRRALKVKNTAFSTYYGAGWESQLQFCLLMTLLVMACILPHRKLFGGGGPLPQVRYFRAKSSYTIPGSMKRIGDKSKQYQWLRQEYDDVALRSSARDLKVAQAMHKHTYRPIKIPKMHFTTSTIVHSILPKDIPTLGTFWMSLRTGLQMIQLLIWTYTKVGVFLTIKLNMTRPKIIGIMNCHL